MRLLSSEDVVALCIDGAVRFGSLMIKEALTFLVEATCKHTPKSGCEPTLILSDRGALLFLYIKGILTGIFSQMALQN